MAHRSTVAHLATLLLALSVVATACSRGTNPPPVVAEYEPVLDEALHLEPTPPGEAVEPAVTIVRPEDSEILTSPVAMTLAVTPPDPNTETSEVHVFIDESCSAPGSTVVVDSNRFAIDGPIGLIEIELEPGFHTLCVQVMNTAAARSTAGTAEVSVAVLPAGSLDNDDT